jgi:hypothetical protein
VREADARDDRSVEKPIDIGNTSRFSIYRNAMESKAIHALRGHARAFHPRCVGFLLM